MVSERIFNIFIFFESGVAKEYGVYHHSMDGDDITKTSFLSARVSEDQKIARRFLLDRSFTPEEWRAAMRYGDVLGYFEEAFKKFRAPASPIFCITCIEEGIPKIDQQISPGPFRGDMVSEVEGLGAVPDYLVNYTEGNTFLFAELINDDYFKGIRVLFNANLYVSCAKLLMSCIDTLAFVEYGDTPGNFTKWIDTYVDLSPHGITSEELWEFRNSVLHMTNLSSRKVISGKVSPIVPYVGGPDTMPETKPNMPKPFNLYGLIKTIGKGIGEWGEAYNANPDKLIKFIERYDLTISDSRFAMFPYGDKI